jgi:hypothetical protein
LPRGRYLSWQTAWFKRRRDQRKQITLVPDKIESSSGVWLKHRPAHFLRASWSLVWKGERWDARCLFLVVVGVRRVTLLMCIRQLLKTSSTFSRTLGFA